MSEHVVHSISQRYDHFIKAIVIYSDHMSKERDVLTGKTLSWHFPRNGLEQTDSIKHQKLKSASVRKLKQK